MKELDRETQALCLFCTTMKNYFKGILVGIGGVSPGLSGSVLLIIFGLYQKTLDALGNLLHQFRKNIRFLLPMAVGAVAISFCMNRLFKRFYTATYSVIFGIFLSMIPNMLTENCVLGFNLTSAISIAVMVAGFFVSYCLGKREKK